MNKSNMTQTNRNLKAYKNIIKFPHPHFLTVLMLKRVALLADFEDAVKLNTVIIYFIVLCTTRDKHSINYLYGLTFTKHKKTSTKYNVFTANNS